MAARRTKRRLSLLLAATGGFGFARKVTSYLQLHKKIVEMWKESHDGIDW